MICSKCGNELKEGIRFCPSCGEKAEVQQKEEVKQVKREYCPSCGTKLGESARFCENCGFQLDGAAPKSMEKVWNGAEISKKIEDLEIGKKIEELEIGKKIEGLEIGKKLKRYNVCLLISFVVGCLYILYSIWYWGGAISVEDSIEALGAGIASILVLPHLICTFIAIVFNGLGVFMNKRNFALTGAILYTVAGALFIPYIFFVIIEMVLSYIGYSKMSKKETAEKGE